MIIKRRLPGLVLTISLAVIAGYISPFFGKIGVVSIAIIIGCLVSNFVSLHSVFKEGITLSEKQLLSLAIILLGFNLQFSTLLSLGFFPLLMVLLVQSVTIFSGVIIGRVLGLNKKLSMLLGVGNAVCGSSAIAAVSPVIKADQNDVGISIGVVNFLGTLGIFLLPVLAIKIVHFNAFQTSGLIGGSLQAVGQVVASGFSVSDKVGELATIIKMARIVMLGPIIVLISFFVKSIDHNKKVKRQYLPAIVTFFLLCVLLRSLFSAFVPQLGFLWPIISKFSKFILTVAMVGIGMKIKFRDLLSQGPKALLVGILVFFVQLITLVCFLSLFM